MRASIAKMVQSAIKTVGDIAETITYNAISTGTYDTDTGTITNESTPYTLNAVISPVRPTLTGEPDLQANEVSEGLTGDLSILFSSIDLPIVPDTNDTILRGGETYKIIKIIKDPAGASTELRVKRLG